MRVSGDLDQKNKKYHDAIIQIRDYESTLEEFTRKYRGL